MSPPCSTTAPRATGRSSCASTRSTPGLTLDDLAAVVKPGLDGMLIPKANGAEDIARFGHYLDALETEGRHGARARSSSRSSRPRPREAMFALGHLCARPSAPRRADLGRARISPPRIGATDNRETRRRLDRALPDGARRNACSPPPPPRPTPIDTHPRRFPRSRRSRARLPALAARRLSRPHGDPPGSGRDHQPLLHARPKPKSPTRGASSTPSPPSRRRRLGHRRQDGRHSASQGRAQDARFASTDRENGHDASRDPCRPKTSATRSARASAPS